MTWPHPRRRRVFGEAAAFCLHDRVFVRVDDEAVEREVLGVARDRVLLAGEGWRPASEVSHSREEVLGG